MMWPFSPLESLCSQAYSGGTPSTTNDAYYGGDIPWLRTQEVTFNRIVDTEIKITEAGLKNSAAKWVPENSVIVAMYGNSAGRVAINEIPLTTNQACCNLVINPEKADYRYVFYALFLSYEALKSLSRGAAQNNLNAAQVKAFSIQVPPVNNQRAVGNILSAYDDLIENNRRRMVLLEEAARQVYQEWFVRLRFPGHEHTRIVDGVPEGWERKGLGELCADARETVSPADLEPDTPYIGLEHMPRRSISLSEWGNVEDVTSTKLSFREGDILFGKIRPYFHKVGVAFVDGVISSDAFVIRPNTPELHGLILAAVSSDPFIAATSQGMKEGSKMPRADWKQMKQYPVLLPPNSLLNTFDGTVQAIIAQLKTLTFQTQKLRTARDLLLPKLMSGEIAV